MDGVRRSSEELETLVKKRNSSGCLIVRKKPSPAVVLESKKEKRRPRLILANSESSEEFEPLRYEINRFHNDTAVDNAIHHSVANDMKRFKLEVSEFGEIEGTSHEMRTGVGRLQSCSAKSAMIRKNQSLRNTETGYSKGNDFQRKGNGYHLSESCGNHRFRSEERIRVQGRSGVLKVMVNNRNKLIRSSGIWDIQHKNSCLSHEHMEGKSSIRKPDGKTLQSKVSSGDIDEDGKQKHGGDADASGSIRKLEEKGTRTGTEKQQLREHIKGMLIAAGWNIEYRPRRNRDYLDAVYISPTGTAFWSIIKAYDALLKQKDRIFSPISEEVINKLTRKTKKKMEKESKKQGDKHHKEKGICSEEKLCLSVKQSNSMGNVSEERASSVAGRRSKKTGRCTLLIRHSTKGQNPEIEDGFLRNQGKKTLLSWMIDSGAVRPSEKVHYMNRKHSRVMLEGWITREGIHCGCCSKILAVSKFELHAGSKLRQPFQNIFLKYGKSLLDCQLEAWNRQKGLDRSGYHAVDVDDDPNDDTCAICGDGGDLICCDGCPSTFHQSCLNIEMLPPGDWHCPNCSCKYCGISEEDTVLGSNGTASRLLICTLCHRKYHDSCIVEREVLSLGSNVFCAHTCLEMYEHLQRSLGVKHELEGGFSWSLLHRTDPDSETSLKGLPQIIECNSKLAVALSVIDECFLPIIDRRSGIHLIHNVVYNCGSNFSRLDYSGFYTVILERGDEIISAASIRMHGTQLAEMPFIGTRHIYRRQGMCRRLFHAVELALTSLKVEKLVIPAIPDLINTWTGVFGFIRVEDSYRKEMKSLNMLVFPDIDMLQKPLQKPQLLIENEKVIENASLSVRGNSSS